MALDEAQAGATADPEAGQDTRSGRWANALTDHTSSLHSVAFAPDGRPRPPPASGGQVMRATVATSTFWRTLSELGPAPSASAESVNNTTTCLRHRIGPRVEDSDLVRAGPLPDTGQILRSFLTAGECRRQNGQLIGQRST